MGQISVQIAGRNYPLACRDGEEAHLERLAAHLASKTKELTASLGPMSEPRLLLMAGILIADELFEKQAGGAPAPGGGGDAPERSRLDGLAQRLEALADVLESNAAA